MKKVLVEFCISSRNYYRWGSSVAHAKMVLKSWFDKKNLKWFEPTNFKIKRIIRE